MNNLAEIPNWCQQRLPPTGLSGAATLTITGLLSIFAGYCLLKGSRRTIGVGLVVVVGVGVLVTPSPASAVSGITCPAGYEVYPQPAKMSIDFAGARLPGKVPEYEGIETTESTFTLNVDLNGGTIYQPFTVEIAGSAVATRSLNAGPRVVAGAGWTVASKNGDNYSGAMILTYSPSGATTKLPPVDIRFGLELNNLKLGGNWTVTAAATGIPAATASASAGYPYSLYWDGQGTSCADFVDTYWARVEPGPVVKPQVTILGGSPPFTYVADGLSGYAMAADGTVTVVDATPGTDDDFTLTVRDANGATLTVPGSIGWAEDFIYLPVTC